MDKLFALQNNHAEITFDFIDQQVYSICAIVRSGDEFPVEEVPELSDKAEEIRKSTKKGACLHGSDRGTIRKSRIFVTLS